MINKVAITPANVTDSSGFKHACPSQGACYLDKGYCINSAPRIAKSKEVHLAAIQKNNMKGKNKDKDRWYSVIRSPYERVFSQREQRVRYRGVAKNQFAATFRVKLPKSFSFIGRGVFKRDKFFSSKHLIRPNRLKTSIK